MLTDNTIVVLVIVVALVGLAVVQTVLAVLHDRVVAAAGPIEELAVYERRLEEKQRALDDLEEDVQKRRDALADVTDRQGDVDSLLRQREELRAEWESLQDRRDSVADVRRQIEEAMVERQGLESELIPLREEYLSIKERLDNAQALLEQTSELEARKIELHDAIEGQSETLAKLDRANAELAEVKEQASNYLHETTRLEGMISAQASEAAELATRLTEQRKAISGAQTENIEVSAMLASGKIKLQELGETRETLDARLAYLKAEIAKNEGRSVDGETNEADALSELKETPPVIYAMRGWPDAPRENEADAIKRVERRLRAKALDYPARTLRAFHTAMKVNETTQMAVLAGISGTGKSQLPRQYAAAMGIGFLQVPVQPRWDSPQDLMGFYNYIEGRFRPTDMARALFALDNLNNQEAEKDRMMMILLDEMNLARVEYYFSDFLSRLESRPRPDDVGDKNERKDAEIELEIPKMVNPPRIFPGYNLLFAGTMNEDESTQSLSDKVVDRANIIRFSAPKKMLNGKAEGNVEPTLALSQQTWKSWRRSSASGDRDRRITSSIDQMLDIMRDFKCPFGHRLGLAIIDYATNYPEVEGGRGVNDALADQVEMRLLPKLRGVEIETVGPQFSRLTNFVERELGDDALAQAINESMSLSEPNGQFEWSGVTR